MVEVIAPPIYFHAAQRRVFCLICFHSLAKTQNNMEQKNSLPMNLALLFQLS